MTIPVKHYNHAQFLPVLSTDDTLEQMIRLAIQYKDDLNPYIHLEIREIFDLVKNLPYNYAEEQFGEILQRPSITFACGGDCDDKSIVLAAYFLKRFPQYDIFYKVVDYDGAGFSHVYVTVFNKNVCYVLDATYPENQFNYEKKYIDSKFYKVN